MTIPKNQHKFLEENVYHYKKEKWLLFWSLVISEQLGWFFCTLKNMFS
jgi:hypothetical protein